MEICNDVISRKHDLMIAVCANSADISVVRSRFMKLAMVSDTDHSQCLVAEKSTATTSSLCGTITSTANYATVFLQLMAIARKHTDVVGYLYAYDGLVRDQATPSVSFEITHGKVIAIKPRPAILSSSLVRDQPAHSFIPDSPIRPLTTPPSSSPTPLHQVLQA
jgi:hypothetical protein